MSKRKYYSNRTDQAESSGKLNLNILLRLFRATYEDLLGKGYFIESFGAYKWNDQWEYSGGTLDWDIEAYLYKQVRKENLWPIEREYSNYSEVDLFDIIEFLHDHISKPIPQEKDSWYSNKQEVQFDQHAARKEFVNKVNELLSEYESESGSKYHLSDIGEIVIAVDAGLETLIEAEIPANDPENINLKVQVAVKKFRSFRSTLDERKDAIRDLADVLEFLRPTIKKILTKKDENDLFNIANNFGIRHHNEKQQTNYDKPIWYSWMFYYYLATIHACLRLVEKNKTSN